MKIPSRNSQPGSTRIHLMAIALATFTILVLTWIALHSGIAIIYQNAYYIPIILSCYFFQRRGLYFSIGLICIYLLTLVWAFPTIEIILQGLVQVLFFLLIALLVTYLSETIQREKSRYKGIFSSSESAIIIFRKAPLEIIEANPQCTEITGYSGEELVGSNVADLFLDKDRLAPSFAGVDGPFTHHETVLMRKDGDLKTVLLSTGSAEHGIGTVTMQDISLRKQAEETIKASEEKFRMLFEHSGDPIMILGMDGSILEVNSAAVKMLGYTRDELTKMNARDIDTPDNTALFEKRMRELHTSGRILFETAHRTTSGEAIPIEVHATLIRFQGKPSILSTPRDISERKRAEIAIQQANRKLNLLNSITRHDILNSLTALMGYLELSLEDTKDPQMREYIHAEMRAAQTIRKQIEFTRDYQDVGVKSPGWFSVPVMIRQMRSRIEDSKARIEIDLPNFEIFADPLVEKVFYNLMENAIRHGEHTTRISFTSEERDGNLVIACSDDGPGVPLDKKKAIFNREYFKHSGFGLFLSREILGITGIQIQENGVPGKGARFELIIPPEGFRYP